MKQVLLYAKELDGSLVFDNKKQLSDFLAENKTKTFIVQLKRETGRRTDTQNNALHLGFDFIAKTLNEKGLDMKAVLKEDVDIPWDTYSVKEYLFKPIMKAMFRKESTTELDKASEINEVWDVLMKLLGEKFEIEYIPFPSEINK